MTNDERLSESHNDSKCDCNKHSNETCLNVLNMATHDHVTPVIKGPETFDGSEVKLEEFLISFERYSKILGFKEERKAILVTAFMTPEAINKYEKTQGGSWETRMRSAFSKEKNILEIMKELVEIRIGDKNPSEVFKKIDELVEKLVEKKLGKKELSDLAYANAIEDREVRREMTLRNATKAEDIKNIQEKIYEFELKDRNIRVDAYTTKENKEWKKVEYRTRRPRPRYEERKIEEPRRNFKARRIICRACHEEGHVRRECPNVKCNHCNKKGHVRTQCYENPNRFREREQSGREDTRNRRNERKEYTNTQYRGRMGYTNRRDQVAELEDFDDEWERMSERSNKRGSLTRRENITNKKNFRDEQGNEEARSQGEVISALH